MSVNPKRYYYKIYSNNLVYITTWSADVVSEPSFKQVINSGSGELVVTLARPAQNFGEGNDVALGNRVELWVADDDNLSNNAISSTLWDSAVWDVDTWDSPVRSFVKIFGGFISAYAPVIENENQFVEITVLSYANDAASRILTDSSGNTTVSYSSQDPGTIMRDIIDKYRASGGTKLNYSGTSIQYTGTTASYTFRANTIQECFNKIIQMTPVNWFWFIDANGLVYLSPTSSTADHSVTLGRDLSYFRANKRIENVVNRVYVIGGGNPNLFNVYNRSSSQNTYGLFEAKIQDGQVTDNATADLIAKNKLDREQQPETRTVIRITDNNGEGLAGQNIEDYSVGDTIQIKNLKYGNKSYSLWDQAQWDVDVWDATINYSSADILVIQSIQYYKDYIEVEASTRLPEIDRRVEQVNQLALTTAQNNLPSAPTTRSI